MGLNYILLLYKTRVLVEDALSPSSWSAHIHVVQPPFFKVATNKAHNHSQPKVKHTY